MTGIEPFAWKNRPSLVESILPAQKISAEAQKERKAGAGQTLTSLGSYWKGRKPLILVKACVLGALLPASNDPAGDLAIFEKLMAIDDEAFLRREMIPSCLELFKRLHSMGWMKDEEANRLFVIHRRNLTDRKIWEIKPFEITEIDSLVNSRQAYVGWAEGLAAAETALAGNCAGFRVSTTLKGLELRRDQRSWTKVHSSIRFGSTSIAISARKLIASLS